MKAIIDGAVVAVAPEPDLISMEDKKQVLIAE
jgi:hypothetical protein